MRSYVRISISFVCTITEISLCQNKLLETLLLSDAISESEVSRDQGAEQCLAPTRSTLFRKQALDTCSVRQYGTVILTRAISNLVSTCVSLLFVLLLILFFLFFETTRKAPIHGILVPTAGVIRVFANQVGVIKQIRIKEGQVVREGEILFVVSGERSTSDPRTTEALISKLLEERRDSFYTELKQNKMQLAQRHATLQQRALDLQREIERLDKQMLIQTQRIALSEETVVRFTQLKATNYISTAKLQEQEAELLDQRQRLLEIERIKSVTQRDLASAKLEELDLTMQAMRDENSLRRNASILEQDLTENMAKREIAVRARQSGTITTIAANLGQTVGITTPLASILPAGSELEAEMYVPSRAVGFIKPGMIASLRYQAFPYQKFGQHPARVREVATTSISPQELTTSAVIMPASSPFEPVYRIRLKLEQQTVRAYGTVMPLRSGMLVDANVVLERRKLYEWILEPLISISGRI